MKMKLRMRLQWKKGIVIRDLRDRNVSFMKVT